VQPKYNFHQCPFLVSSVSNQQKVSKLLYYRMYLLASFRELSSVSFLYKVSTRTHMITTEGNLVSMQQELQVVNQNTERTNNGKGNGRRHLIERLFMSQLHYRGAFSRDHAVLPATHTFVHKWNEPYLPLPS